MTAQITVPLSSGISLFCYDNHNDKGENLLFLHGWGGSHISLTAIYGPLSVSHRIIAPDLPGFGESTRPPRAFDSFFIAECIVELIHSLKISNLHIIGHSIGGKIAMIIADTLPQSVRSLLLIDASGIPPKRSVGWYLRVGTYKLAKWFILAILRNKDLLEKLRSRAGSDDYRNAGNMRDVLSLVVKEDVTEIASRISCPVFLIWGEKDTATPLWMAKRLHKLIADCGLHVVPGAGHYSFLEDTAVVAITEALVKRSSQSC